MTNSADSFTIKDTCLANRKFIQYLDIDAIEKTYQKLNLIDFSQVDDKTYYYLKGAIDSVYSFIGVQTPLKKVIDANFKDDIELMVEQLLLVTSGIEFYAQAEEPEHVLGNPF